MSSFPDSKVSAISETGHGRSVSVFVEMAKSRADVHQPHGAQLRCVQWKRFVKEQHNHEQIK